MTKRFKNLKVGDVVEDSDHDYHVVTAINETITTRYGINNYRFNLDGTKNGMDLRLLKKVLDKNIHVVTNLDYIVQFKRGKMEIGCQTINKVGQLELFKILADKLGYELED